MAKRKPFKMILLVLVTVTGMLLGSVSLTGCGSDLPFEYRYTSANSVQIRYQDRTYTLNRFGPKLNTPFEYEFESDGDIDITIAGKTYDIDSPYDIDSSKKKKKKKKTTKKKTTTKKSSTKRKKK